jgi:hypothetical protein
MSSTSDVHDLPFQKPNAARHMTPPRIAAVHASIADQCTLLRRLLQSPFLPFCWTCTLVPLGSAVQRATTVSLSCVCASRLESRRRCSPSPVLGKRDITCQCLFLPWLLAGSHHYLTETPLVMVARLVQILGAQVPAEPLTTGHICLEALRIPSPRGRYIAEPKSSIRSTSRATPHTPVPWFILVSSWVAEA